MPPYDLIDRTARFAQAIREFCQQLPGTRECEEIASQLRRAANSTRANYRAARKGRSHDEFTSKLQTAFEEADESLGWLEHLRDSKIREDPELLNEARELSAILGAAVKTARLTSNDVGNNANVVAELLTCDF